MKTISTILFLVPAIVFSQLDLWPTANAKWTYSSSADMGIGVGYTEFKIERDTLILGKTCQIYSKREVGAVLSIPTGGSYNYFQPIYRIMTLENSVLKAYNETITDFDTIVNFSANIGDTWKTQLYTYPDGCSDLPGFAMMEVLSKEIVSINGENLIKFEIRKTSSQFSVDETFTFHQLIGGSERFIHEMICNLDENRENGFRCFYENELDASAYSYKAFAKDCNYYSTVGVNELKDQNKLTIINPVVDQKIVFKNIQVQDIKSISISDASGRKIAFNYFMEADDLVLKTEKILIDGSYFYQFQFKSGTLNTGKFIVQND